MTDTRLRCVLCLNFTPKDLSTHSCHAHGKCTHCSKAVAGPGAAFCKHHKRCHFWGCLEIVYKRRKCDKHECRANYAPWRRYTESIRKCPSDATGIFCTFHRVHMRSRVSLHGCCYRCGKALWQRYVPYWLRKDGRVTRDVARVIARRVLESITQCETCEMFLI